MSSIDEAEAALRRARNALNARRLASSDPAEKASLLAQVNRINAQLAGLAHQSLEAASLAVMRAADDVEGLLRTAKVNVFSATLEPSLKELSDTAVALADTVSRRFAADAPPARDPGEEAEREVVAAAPIPAPTTATTATASTTTTPITPARPVTTTATTAPRPSSAGAPIRSGVDGLPPLVRGTTLTSLAEDYTLCWAACRIRDEHRAAITASVERLLRGNERYQAVQARTRVPWQLIGIKHGLECGYDFNKHLHNGDSLRALTVRVPAGRPPGWTAGRSWEDSARDALELKKLHQVLEWTLPRTLYALESFNGFGYRSKDTRSPYLWSFSNLYSKGKYVADHVFDPNATSKQIGAAVILKALEERGLWP